jgi:hypothetical protein
MTLLDRAGQAKSRKRPVLPELIALRKSFKKHTKTGRSLRARGTPVKLAALKVKSDVLHGKVHARVRATEQERGAERKERLHQITSV